MTAPARFDPRTLPPSIRDARTLAFADVFGSALEEPDFRRLLMERVAEAPAEALPALIREFSIEEFVEPGMRDEVVRGLLSDAYALHAAKGTLAGIRRGLALLGLSVRWTQWFERTPRSANGTHRAVVLAGDAPLFDGQAMVIEERVQRAAQRMIDGTKRWSQDVEVLMGIDLRIEAVVAPVAQFSGCITIRGEEVLPIVVTADGPAIAAIAQVTTIATVAGQVA